MKVISKVIFHNLVDVLYSLDLSFLLCNSRIDIRSSYFSLVVKGDNILAGRGGRE